MQGNPVCEHFILNLQDATLGTNTILQTLKKIFDSKVIKMHNCRTPAQNFNKLHTCKRQSKKHDSKLQFAAK